MNAPTSWLLAVAAVAMPARDAVAAGLIFKSETSRGGEIGFKSQLADRTITLNATAAQGILCFRQVPLPGTTSLPQVTRRNISILLPKRSRFFTGKSRNWIDPTDLSG